MLRGMPLALRSTQSAGLDAGLQHALDQRLVRPRPAARDGACRTADVGAVQVEANTLPKLSDHLLSGAGVRAGGARLCAVVRCVYGHQQRFVRIASNVWVGSDHFVRVHITSVCVAVTPAKQHASAWPVGSTAAWRTPRRLQPNAVGASGSQATVPVQRARRLGGTAVLDTAQTLARGAARLLEIAGMWARLRGARWAGLNAGTSYRGHAFVQKHRGAEVHWGAMRPRCSQWHDTCDHRRHVLVCSLWSGPASDCLLLNSAAGR